MKKKYRILLMFVGLFFIVFPTYVFAESYLERKAGGVVAYLLGIIFKPIFESMVGFLTGILSTPDLKELVFVGTAVTYAKYIASVLLITQLSFRVWKNMTSRGFADQSEPLPDIFWRTGLSGALIYGMPEILDYLLKINAALITVIGHLGVDFKQQLANVRFPEGAGLAIVAFFCIWIVAVVALTISNAIRLAELCFLYIIGPIMAVSHAGKGESFQIWIMQAVAVSLTQCVQFLLVGLSLNLSADLMREVTLESLLLPIGSVVVAIRGPQLLKQFMYTTGTGGAISSAAKTVVYSRMMRR